MRVLLATLFILVFFNGPIWAQPVENPYLYRFSSPLGNSYILGSIHTGIKLKDFPLDLKALIQGADRLLLELEFTPELIELWEKDGLAALQTQSLAKPYPVDPVSPETAQLLVDFGLPLETAVKAREGDIGILSLPYQYMYGLPLDAEINRYAHEIKQPILALDTYQLREEASARKSRKLNITEILEMIPPEKLKQQIEEKLQDVLKTYRKGLEEKASTSADAIYRTEKWVPKIISQLEKENLFIVVGNSHLFGPQGLLRLLEQSGYKFERVLFSTSEKCRFYLTPSQ